ncbi:MAG TPA: hypothetical protein ENG74_03480 [Thermoplasmatales archaeon]|nr:hypothetical protein [Thermoplasmatales archaeon]
MIIMKRICIEVSDKLKQEMDRIDINWEDYLKDVIKKRVALEKGKKKVRKELSKVSKKVKRTIKKI